MAYYPYGEIRAKPIASIDVHHKFTGQEYDDETGLYFYGARYYDPILARFISPDTIDPRLENPQTLNRYSHALDNPVKFVDPNGHFAFIPFLVAGAAAFAWDAFHTPDIANGPKTENEIVQSPSVLDHFGSLVTGATIGFAGASAFVKEGIQAGVKATVGEIIQAESPVPIGSNSLAKGTK
ncbi:MAG: RHS repeat-associated core domain-containing protein [Nitrospirae bacterium]|nr:RHS repeat-associated core domain-containing protein [Nitrospirota bacterium]